MVLIIDFTWPKGLMQSLMHGDNPIHKAHQNCALKQAQFFQFLFGQLIFLYSLTRFWKFWTFRNLKKKLKTEFFDYFGFFQKFQKKLIKKILV